MGKFIEKFSVIINQVAAHLGTSLYKLLDSKITPVKKPLQ